MFDFDLFRQMLTETVREVVREEFAALQSPAPAEEDGLLTIEEVCERLSISKTTLWTLRRNGEIAGHNVGRRVLFKASDVNALVEGSP
jgi:excisionase family DNA binding protein